MNDDRYDLVMVLNYYAPYVSGLTEAARMIAEDMASSGSRVLVVTCRHDRVLPRREQINGVDVVRAPVIARIGKGLISPSFVMKAISAARRATVVNLHLPMIESGLIALLSRGTRTVVTYQCDIALPKGVLNRLQTLVMDISNALAFAVSDAVVPSSLDYAESSRLRSFMKRDRLHPISPPTRLHPRVKGRFRSGSGPHVGFLGRLVEEKGLEYLVDGFRALDDPAARLLIAGDFTSVAGGSTIDLVREHIADDDRIELLGFLDDTDLAEFYSSLDVFALPSVNSFEAFGISQIEAMRLGVPSLASDLPGVRTPVQRTGFGVIVPARSAAAITNGLRDIVASGLDTQTGAQRTSAIYSLEDSADAYSTLFFASAT